MSVNRNLIYRAPNKRVSLQVANRMLAGQTQFTPKTLMQAVKHYGFEWEEPSESPGPGHELTEPQRVDGVFKEVWRASEPQPVKERIKIRRDQAIYAGITFNSLPIDTDEVTQGRLAGAALQTVIDPSYTVNWKAAGQFYTLDANQIITVAQAVRAHVQGCFDREAELLSLTDPESGEPREPTTDEIDSGWPA